MHTIKVLKLKYKVKIWLRNRKQNIEPWGRALNLTLAFPEDGAEGKDGVR